MQLKKIDALNKPYRIYADYVESGAIDQFVEAMSQECVVQGALMPDVHSGYTVPIGSVIACKDMIFPSAVGYDIGCGMCAVPTSFDVADIRGNSKAIFDEIYKAVPVGFNHNANSVDATSLEALSFSSVVDGILEKGGFKQLGTLGSGNHFIEIGADESNQIWIVIHSGSRNVGHSVATHYMKAASGTDKAKEGFYGLSTASANGHDYILDLKFCLEFALANRLEMVQRVVKILASFTSGGAYFGQLINRNHNHAEIKDGLWIHRKGACSADRGELNIIPGNMREGGFIVEGLGNPDSMNSSSHGAGRVMGRSKAKSTLDMATFEKSMQGITAKVTAATLDESPLAYKDIYEVMDLQKSLVKVLHHIKPLINIKA